MKPNQEHWIHTKHTLIIGNLGLDGSHKLHKVPQNQGERAAPNELVKALIQDWNDLLAMEKSLQTQTSPNNLLSITKLHRIIH